MSSTDSTPLANVFTLGVRDVARMRAFYAALGWPQVMDDDDFVVFELRGALLALFPVDKLAADGRTEPETGRGGVRFTIGMTVERPEDVDAVAERMRAAGARITKPPVDAEFFEGRSCYLADPEGNFWEIVWATAGNPVLAAARRAAGGPES